MEEEALCFLFPQFGRDGGEIFSERPVDNKGWAAFQASQEMLRVS